MSYDVLAVADLCGLLPLVHLPLSHRTWLRVFTVPECRLMKHTCHQRLQLGNWMRVLMESCVGILRIFRVQYIIWFELIWYLDQVSKGAILANYTIFSAGQRKVEPVWHNGRTGMDRVQGSWNNVFLSVPTVPGIYTELWQAINVCSHWKMLRAPWKDLQVAECGVPETVSLDRPVRKHSFG